MPLLARAAIAPLLIAALAACGSEGGEDKAADGGSGPSAAPTAGSYADFDYPTDASVEDYCTAYKGEEPEFDEATTTIGDVTEFLETGAEKIVETGIPEEFTDAQKAAFDQQLEQFDTALVALKDLKMDDTLVTDVRDDAEVRDKLGGAMELDTPQALRDFSSENC